MRKKTLVVKPEVQLTMEYQHAKTLLNLKKGLRERLKLINMELREISRISRSAFALALRDVNADPSPFLSPLSQTVTRNDKSVHVKIYPDGLGHWILEVMDDGGAAFVWYTVFHTEEEALEEALRTIDESGVGTMFVPSERCRKLICKVEKTS